MKAHDPARLAYEVFNEIGILAHLSRTEFERVLPPGLSFAGFGVLNRILRLGKDGENPARIARAFQVTKGAMTNTLQRLEAEGLVVVKPDAVDARGKTVHITKKGSAAVATALTRVQPLLCELLGDISAQRLASTLPVLTQLRKYLDARRD